MKQAIASQWIENVVNKYIALDPEGLKNLSALKGKVLSVEVLGLNKQYTIIPEDTKVSVSAESEVKPDTIIRGLPSALLKLSVQVDTAPLMLSGEIEIIGDVRLGREFKIFLSNLKIDWDEHLSSVIGDVPTTIISNAASKISSWATMALTSLKDDVSEYLQEESRDVVTGAELNGFNKKVDQLRDDVDRLVATIKTRSTDTNNN